VITVSEQKQVQQQEEQEKQEEPDAVMCCYEECSQDPITNLEIDGEEIPVCNNHIQALMEKHQEDDSPGMPPVLSNSDDEAAWINTDKNGKPYLAVKTEDGEYINLFAQTALMQDALNRQHEVQKQG